VVPEASGAGGGGTDGPGGPQLDFLVTREFCNLVVGNLINLEPVSRWISDCKITDHQITK
jgi:hypothetical protein